MAKRDNLKQDADQVLQGIRIVLPGTQALMGFQFIAIFNQIFQSLSPGLKFLHFASLLCTIVCSIVLIALVAFQQIGEDGSATKNFLSYTRKMIGTAMAFLLLAIVIDVYLAGKLIGATPFWAASVSALVFIFGTFLWHVFALLYRENSR